MEASRAIIQSAIRTRSTTDSTGRVLVVRNLTALDTLRLFKAAGPALSQNEAWLGMASLAFAVSEIDHVPVPTPVSEPQIEGLIERLGEAGLAAIAAALNTDTAPAGDANELKNSLGTRS